MERRIPTVFVTTHGAYPYTIKNNKIHIRYNIIPEGMTVYILETSPLGVCNINTALDNNLIGNKIEKYMKYGIHKEDLIYEIVNFMDQAHKDYTEDLEESAEDLEESAEDLEESAEDERLINLRIEGKMYSLKKLVGGDYYDDKNFSRDSNDKKSYNETNFNKEIKYEMRINFMNLEIKKEIEDIRDSTTFRVYDMLGPDMDKEIYLSKIIKRIYESGFKHLLIIDNSCSSFYAEGEKLDSEENLHKLYNDRQVVWLNTNIPNESDTNKRKRLLNTIHNVLNEEKPNEDDEKPNEHHEKKRIRLLNKMHNVYNEENPIKKQKKGGKRRKSKNHRRKRTNRKTNKKRLDR